MVEEIKIEKEGEKFLAKKGDLEVGRIFFEEHPESIHIVDVGVDHDFRGQGIAKSLIAKVIEHARDLEKKKITAEIDTVEPPQLHASLIKYDNRIDKEMIFDANIDDVISYFKSVLPGHRLTTLLRFHAEDLEAARRDGRLMSSIAFTLNSPSERAFLAHDFENLGRAPTEEHGEDAPKKYIIIGSDGKIKESDKPTSKGVKLPALAVSFFRILLEKNLKIL
jgi:predicted GNAT family acetyltransferase